MADVLKNLIKSFIRMERKLPSWETVKNTVKNMAKSIAWLTGLFAAIQVVLIPKWTQQFSAQYVIKYCMDDDDKLLPSLFTAYGMGKVFLLSFGYALPAYGALKLTGYLFGKAKEALSPTVEPWVDLIHQAKEEVDQEEGVKENLTEQNKLKENQGQKGAVQQISANQTSKKLPTFAEQEAQRRQPLTYRRRQEQQQQPVRVMVGKTTITIANEEESTKAPAKKGTVSTLSGEKIRRHSTLF